MKLTKTKWLLFLGTMALLAVVLLCGCAPILAALDQPATQEIIIDAPKTVGGVLGGLGIPVSDAAGAVTSTLLAAGFALYNWVRRRKTVAIVDAHTSDVGANNADSADIVMDALRKAGLVK